MSQPYGKFTPPYSTQQINPISFNNVSLMSPNTPIELSNVTNWSPNYNTIGIKPPYPATIVPPSSEEPSPGKNFNSWKGTNINVMSGGPYPLWKINSARKPFAVQYLVNPYGGLATKIGTELGR
jgi:hypothetical protein